MEEGFDPLMSNFSHFYKEKGDKLKGEFLALALKYLTLFDQQVIKDLTFSDKQDVARTLKFMPAFMDNL